MLNLSQAQIWEEAQYDWKILGPTMELKRTEHYYILEWVSRTTGSIIHDVSPCCIVLLNTTCKPICDKDEIWRKGASSSSSSSSFGLGCFKPGLVFHVNALWILCLVSRPGLHKHGSWALWHVSRPGLLLPLPVLCSCRSPLLSNN